METAGDPQGVNKHHCKSTTKRKSSVESRQTQTDENAHPRTNWTELCGTTIEYDVSLHLIAERSLHCKQKDDCNTNCMLHVHFVVTGFSMFSGSDRMSSLIAAFPVINSLHLLTQNEKLLSFLFVKTTVTDSFGVVFQGPLDHFLFGSWLK